MPTYVFRIAAGGAGEVLFFDGLRMVELPTPLAWQFPDVVSDVWGKKGAGAARLAAKLCAHCGCPDDLMDEVCPLFMREWVERQPCVQTAVPAWMVQQEVLKICLRVMTDLNGN